MEKPFVAMAIPIRQLSLANNEALKLREVEETFYKTLARILVEFTPTSENSNMQVVLTWKLLI